MEEAAAVIENGVNNQAGANNGVLGSGSSGDSRYITDSLKTILTEERMRKRLQFFFMNPIEKWHAKQRFPYKFMVQIVKIVLVTMQLCLFAYTRYNHVNYTWDNKITFSHLFLRGWDATREVNSYPPSIGPLAVYKVEDFFATLDHAYEKYMKLNESVGSYSYANEDNTPMDMLFCIYEYKEGIIYGFNESYVFNNEIVERCLNISRSNVGQMLNSEDFLEKNNLDISFSALVKANLMFSLKTVNFKAASRITAPNCYRFDITISFNNEDHDGQILLSLDAEANRLQCNGETKYVTDSEVSTFLRSLLNYLVIITCVVSLVLCSRAVWRAQQLKDVTIVFFRKHFDKELSAHDRNKFLNLWYIMIIVNDVLIIMGSAIKDQIERSEFTSDQWNICSLFLGIGNMLVWFGVLRYLGFFKTYNVVILTLQKAAPQVARFLLCACLIYAGFTFCGWLILGPYHLKFRSLSTTSECLFSLINGDDMFATFSIMSNKSVLLWWFARVYLYSFISLYIYIILSLFISVIMDAYETIKQYYEEGFPKSDLEEFMGETRCEDLSSGLFRHDSSESLGGMIKDLCCCCPRMCKNASSYSNLGRQSSSNDETLIIGPGDSI